MIQTEPPITVTTAEPVVKLIAYTENPYALSIASARTCYSPGLVFTDQVSQGQKERIGKSIYEAGHHTPFQHPTFVFGLENISRQFTWSFLHSHPFYNSEQSSQRYNVLNEAKVYVPPLEGGERRIYDEAILLAWSTYNRLSHLLVEDNYRLMASIGRRKRQTDKQIRVDSEKKAIENARYVLPVAAFTSMYHTVSGIMLQRYWRMAETGDCPTETRRVVQAMVDAVKAVDPDFFGMIGEPPLPRGETPEERFHVPADPESYCRDFDRKLAMRTSQLIHWDPDAEKLLSDAVREVMGVGPDGLTDDHALDLVLNPARNPYLLDTLNAWSMSPLLRTLNHATYTFRKKLSHAADSQDQRHRTVPASRPLLTRVHTHAPDYIMPDIIARNDEAAAVYQETMEQLWAAKNQLLNRGMPAEFACYLMPNATAIRFTQTGSLLDLMHKWRMRTCFLAQLEIYQASMEELAQVSQVHPRLTKYIGPPCVYLNGLGDEHELEGPCPEGSRWCGIDVWKNFPKTKRPF